MPYSDNLYSMVDDESDFEDDLNQLEPRAQGSSQSQQPRNDTGASAHPGISGLDTSFGAADASNLEAAHLSPANGYFHSATGAASNAPVTATSSNVPHVPNVWVEDPSLQQRERSNAESKAREAEEERLANRDHPLTAPRHTYAGIDHSFRTAATSRSNPSSAYTTSAPSHRGSGLDLGSNSVLAAYPQPSSSSSAYAPSTTPSYTSYVPRRAAYNGRSSFMPREAPPAYTPSPTSPTSNQGASDASARNYSTFPHTPLSPSGNMGRREESQGLLAHDPESMGGPADNADDDAPLLRDRLRKRVSSIKWRSRRGILIGLFIFILAAGFFVSLMRGTKDEKKHNSDKLPFKDRPIKEPVMDYPGLDDEFQWRATHLCKGVQIPRRDEQFDISFDSSKQFILIQDIDNGRGDFDRNIYVQGTVILRRVGDGTPGPSIIVKTTVNDDRISVVTDWNVDQQALRVTVPRGMSWVEADTGPCVNIMVTVWVPEDASLTRLDVETIHLDIQLMDNLSLNLSQIARLSSVVGSITAASTGNDAQDDNIIDVGAPDSFKLNSRYIEVKTTSSPIKGSWPLYDYLGLQGTSGNIKVCIEPKEANKDAPKPAILYVKSLSGDVVLREPIEAASKAWALSSETNLRAETVLPPRDYRVDIHTTSGNVKGSLAFSSQCNIKTTSGKVTPNFLPVLDSSLANEGSKEVYLSTSTTSGNIDVTVLEPLWVNGSKGEYTNGPSPPQPPQPPQPPRPPTTGGEDHRSQPTPGKEHDGEYIPIGKIGNGDPYSSLPGPVQPQRRGIEKVENVAPALRCLYAQLTATSADMRLRLPSVWEGDLVLSTLSGNLRATGEGLHQIKPGSDWSGRKTLTSRKGDGGGNFVRAKTTSGDINVQVGPA